MDSEGSQPRRELQTLSGESDPGRTRSFLGAARRPSNGAVATPCGHAPLRLPREHGRVFSITRSRNS